jgi:hypothetical protein
VLDPAQLLGVAETFGVDESQVLRDHLISHLLAAISAEVAEQVVFFGGTALARTVIPDGRCPTSSWGAALPSGRWQGSDARRRAGGRRDRLARVHRPGRVRGRPRPRRAVRTRSSTGTNPRLSCRCPALVTRAVNGRQQESAAR